MTACAGEGEDSPDATPHATATATPVPTPLPPDAETGVRVFQEFVQAVQNGRVEAAWNLYAASIEGTTKEHDAGFGCDFGAFSYEFPRMQNLFGRMTPFQVTETYGAAPGSTIIEMRLSGADGTKFLGTVVRVHSLEEYRVRFLNSGEVAAVPGAPDPPPSPGDPTGICGIWTGPR